MRRAAAAHAPVPPGLNLVDPEVQLSGAETRGNVRRGTSDGSLQGAAGDLGQPVDPGD